MERPRRAALTLLEAIPLFVEAALAPSMELRLERR